MKGRKIMLIGGAGFIGHHLALDFVEMGAEVVIVDCLQVNSLVSHIASSLSTPHGEFSVKLIHQRLSLLRSAGVTLEVIDARDYLQLSKTINTYQPEIVIHLAAVADAGRSNKDPFSTFDHSLRTLENALDASRGNVDHFIFLSSSMVYGDFEEESVHEDSRCNPLGIYGALKFGGEKLVVAYGQVFDLSYTIVRPSALYGERCVSRRVGQIFIENALEGSGVSIHGDGSERLDFTYIKDLVNGIMKVIEHPSSRGEVFNITYGEARSVADLAELLQGYFPELQVDYLPKDRLVPSRGTLCVDKAKELIGYEPEYPLERGLEEYIAWYRSIT